ncbi:MAG: flavodoxin family protein [Clostridiales bacterium]|nr:flavodoxin family protein [Clostridiales bacterium]
MKVLTIIGSPRKKGNTYKVTKRIESKLLSINSSISFEYLFLADCDLKMCRGCFCCFAKGENTCPLKDDLNTIYEKTLQADGIILAAPTYAMGVPALMKNFIDRLSYTLHRPCFFDQSFLAVSTVGGLVGLKETLNQLSLLASAGAKKSLKVGVPMPPISMPLLENKAAKKLKKSVKAFYSSMNNVKRHKPGFGDFAYFAAFKTMSQFESYKEECPADYEYYKEKEAYFYPVKGMRVFLSKVLAPIMRLSFKLIAKDTAST